MFMNKLSLFICLLALLSNLGVVAAVCTATLDKSTCVNDETITATCVCSAGGERDRAYSVEWWNVTGGLIMETDNGTTPADVGTPFFESFTCPSVGTLDGNVTLTGTNLEGSDTFSVVAAAANALIIVNISVTEEVLIGRTAGFKFTVVDENGKAISNAECNADVEDGAGIPITEGAIDFSTRDGEGAFSGVTSIDALSEGRQFVLDIRCTCGKAGTGMSCFDEDGVEVELSSGGIEFPFTVGTWMTVNTITDRLNYIVEDDLFICANVTNPVNRSRQSLIIEYDYRCNGLDDQSTNRVLIASSVESRGIDSNLTQTQCIVFRIPDAQAIEKGATACYASTRVTVLNEIDVPLVTYVTTSPLFNVTSDEVHPNELNWIRIGRTRYRTNVSLNDFDVGVKDIHVVLNVLIDELDTPATSIESFSVTFDDGSAISFDTRLSIQERFLLTEDMSDVVVVEIIGVNTSLNQNFFVTVTIHGGDVLEMPMLFLALVGLFGLWLGFKTDSPKDLPFFLLSGLSFLVFSLYIEEFRPFPVFATFTGPSDLGLFNEFAMLGVGAFGLVISIYAGLGAYRTRRRR